MKQVSLMIAAVLLVSGSSFAMASKSTSVKAGDRNVQLQPQKPKCAAMEQTSLLADTNPKDSALKSARSKDARQ